MAISAKTSKILWSGAAGHCSFPNCPKKLYATDVGNGYTLGEMAHIKGEKLGANRHDPDQSEKDRDAYPNLILLCPTHHTEIDKPENEKKFSNEILYAFKKQHERHVANRIAAEHFSDKRELARALLPLLIENHQIFLNFGPASEIARQRPMSDAYKMWETERISTIVPNNRMIASRVRPNLPLLTEQEQETATTFLMHAKSYEEWVSDTISYEGVVRFPIAFDRMIKDLADARQT